MKERILTMLACCATVAALSSAVFATSGQVSAILDYSDIKITLDGQEVNPVNALGEPVEPFAISGTTYLPVRAIASAVGLEVGLDQETHTVILTSSADTLAARGYDPNGHVIYVTKTGKRYHYDETCNGGTYYPVPYDSAIAMGYTPCDKCVLTVAHPEG